MSNGGLIFLACGCVTAAFFIGADLGYDIAVNRAVEANAGHYEVDQNTGDTKFMWGCADE